MNSDTEKEKLETQEMNSDTDQEGKGVTGPVGSAPAVRHSDPNDPLSRAPRYSGPPKLKPFTGKKWFSFREDLEAVLDRLGCWEITTGEVTKPDKEVDHEGYVNFMEKKKIAREVLTTNLSDDVKT